VLLVVAHEVLLGLKKAEAGSELVLKRRKLKQKASHDGSKKILMGAEKTQRDDDGVEDS
jgi:hypothetical protein